MGGTCCGPSDESLKRDSALDEYMKINHVKMYPHKVPKFDKKDFFLGKQDFEDRTIKARITNEILDDVSRR
jgi:hypothetical protein